MELKKNELVPEETPTVEQLGENIGEKLHMKPTETDDQEDPTSIAAKERKERVEQDKKREQEQRTLETLKYQREKTSWLMKKLKGPAKISAAVTAGVLTIPFIPFSKKVWGSLFSLYNPFKTIRNLGEAIKEEYQITHKSLFGPLPKKRKNY